MSRSKTAAAPGARAANLRAQMDGTRSLVINRELVLYGVIDSYNDGYGDVIRCIDVMASLAELAEAETIVCRLNSPGGSVTEGIAIYNALKAWGKPIEMHIDAYAGSIASIIAMAGTDIVMAENATIMIHDPYGVAFGGSEEMRSAADEIDRFKTILVNIYVQRTGLSAEEVASLMAVETSMSADEAVGKGFADRVAETMRIAAMAPLSSIELARRQRAPEFVRAQSSTSETAAAVPRQEKIMNPTHTAAQVDAAKNDGAKAERQRISAIRAAVRAAQLPYEFGDGLVDDGLSLDDAQARISAETLRSQAQARANDQVAIQNAVQMERDRIHGIAAAVRAAKLPGEFADEMIKEGASLADARARIIDKMAAHDPQTPTRAHSSGIEVGVDGMAKFVEGAKKGLMARAGFREGERNEFTGLTMSELARHALAMRNIKTGSMSRMEMVGLAFTLRNEGPGYHSSSDFGNIIQAVAYRSMMTGYNEVEETFPIWTAKGSASDFRPINRVDMGLFPALEKIEEGAEYKYGSIADTGTVVQIATYGKQFAITRQAIINDDLQFFDRVPRKMGRAAKRTIGNLVYAVLNGNPTMQDGVALFHASTHGNLVASGAPPSVATIGAAMAAMAIQKDDGALAAGGVGVAGKFILVPPTLLMATNTAITSANIPGDAGQVANPVRGAFTPISDARLTGTAWYLAADPVQADTIEVTYLDGVEEPFMDQREGWSVDGTEFKVRIDAGVKALHWRGLYKNAGA